MVFSDRNDIYHKLFVVCLIYLSFFMFRYRYIKCIPDDCVKHETNSRILHVFLISVT